MRFNSHSMLHEPSSLALLVYRIGTTLKSGYGIDPTPLYRELGVDPVGPKDAGARTPNRTIRNMLEIAAKLSGDPAFGIQVGLRSEANNFFVMGHIWLASANLVEAMRQLLRYEEIHNSGNSEIKFSKQGDEYQLAESYPMPGDYPGKLRADVGIASVAKLCSIASGKPIMLRRLEVYGPKDTNLDMYKQFVGGPIEISAKRNALYFAAADLEAPLSGAIPDVVEVSCRIADRYLGTLDHGKIAYQVRARLVQMLPSGRVDQEKVAAALYCSASTLQRQLSAEGTSYRDVLDDTRRELAEAYLSGGKHTHAQTAFLVGFSDQSNFARAFKRWTGMSPGQYQKAATK
ncbi:MAG TPA: AraC family transcriptional regulator ligand-binding domain-containing protein [Woeseiaceae bacterium]|nr:AraC family transcriptional regulator ligand-binding domain-containing protein [Woeseiaceae bacterium]